MLTVTKNLFARELSSEESKFWAEFLGQFSLAELRYAFERWNKTERFFPKPKDISDLVDVFRLELTNSEYPIGCHRCDWTGFYQVRQKGVERFVAECPCRKNVSLREKRFEHQGEGYNWNDMLWLLRRMQQEYAKGDTPDTEALMAELDAKRPGGPPAWRLPA